jgi:hypothetical protein
MTESALKWTKSLDLVAFLWKLGGRLFGTDLGPKVVFSATHQ